jgi:hypothetical protein
MADYELIDHPPHYGGDTVYEHIKVVDAWGLNYRLGIATKHICRAGKKPGASALEDLQKARWYIDSEIKRLEATEPSLYETCLATAEKEPTVVEKSHENSDSAEQKMLSEAWMRSIGENPKIGEFMSHGGMLWRWCVDSRTSEWRPWHGSHGAVVHHTDGAPPVTTLVPPHEIVIPTPMDDDPPLQYDADLNYPQEQPERQRATMSVEELRATLSSGPRVTLGERTGPPTPRGES